MTSKEKKKFFGGYLSLRQVTYLMLSASSLAILALPIILGIKILFITFISIFFLLCTFLKVNEQNFDKFFFYAVKYLIRNKNFVYERCCKC